MKYFVRIKRSAEKELDAVPDAIRTRISRLILVLASEPRPSGSKKLRGQEGYRLRVGDYRVLYTVDDANREVTIHAVGHRRDVYR